MDEEELKGTSDTGKGCGIFCAKISDTLPAESEEESMDAIPEEEEGQSAESAQQKVFIPGRGTALKEGEELVHDCSTYHMYHVVCVYQLPSIIKFMIPS